jgi:hypothetical protein
MVPGVVRSTMSTRRQRNVPGFMSISTGQGGNEAGKVS